MKGNDVQDYEEMIQVYANSEVDFCLLVSNTHLRIDAGRSI